MKQIEIVAQKAKELNYTTTKMQYVLISKIMAEDSVDISPEDCMKICNLQRYCRMVLKSDDVAMAKAKEWEMPDYMRPLEENKQWNDLFKRNALNS